jgi:hypothetical protein
MGFEQQSVPILLIKLMSEAAIIKQKQNKGNIITHEAQVREEIRRPQTQWN